MSNETNNSNATLTAEQILEIQDLAFGAAGDYCKAKNVRKGITKEVHAAIMVHALVELEIIPDDIGLRRKAFFTLCKLENGSQLRQDLEKAKVLGKTETLGDEYL